MPPINSESVGTGFIFENNENYSLIITCAHCISDATSIFISVPILGQEKFKANVISIAPDHRR